MEQRHFTARPFKAREFRSTNGWIPVERKLVPGRVYLVGDAAAQVKVSTVGGVVTGFRGALAVSESILNGWPQAANFAPCAGNSICTG